MSLEKILEFQRECDELKEKYPEMDRLAGMITNRAFPKDDLQMFYMALESFPESLVRNMIRVVLIGERVRQKEMEEILERRFSKKYETKSDGAEQ